MNTVTPEEIRGMAKEVLIFPEPGGDIWVFSDPVMLHTNLGTIFLAIAFDPQSECALMHNGKLWYKIAYLYKQRVRRAPRRK